MWLRNHFFVLLLKYLTGKSSNERELSMSADILFHGFNLNICFKTRGHVLSQKLAEGKNIT